MEYWMKLPQQIRTSIVTALVLIIGAVSQRAIEWIQALEGVAPV